MSKTFTTQAAETLAKSVGIDFNNIDIEQFRMGLTIELEHGAHDPETNVTNDNMEATAKIVWAHLKEIPDYYTRLARMESDAKS